MLSRVTMKLLQITSLAAVLGAAAAAWVWHRAGEGASATPPLAAALLSPGTSAPAIAPTGPDVDAATLDRLARENAELKAELAAVRALLFEQDESLQAVSGQLEELRRPMEADLLSSTLRADMRSGEVVVTGGYRLADGRRLFAFAQPVIHEVEGRSVVMVQGRCLSISDEAAQAVELDALMTNAANTLQHGEVWVPEEEAAVMAALEALPDTEVLPYPGIAVHPGRSGTITVGRDIQLKVTPTLHDSGDGLAMDLRLEQPQSIAEPQAP